MGIDRVAGDIDGHSCAEAGAGARFVGTMDPAAAGSPQAAAELDRLRQRTLARGVNRPLLALTTAILVPLFRVFLRLEAVGETGSPRSGPLLVASNHRSFLDPFVIGAIMRRPIYYVAKRELFKRRWQAWLLGGLGAFPIDRGAADGNAMATAKEILERGECVLIFPEGTRVRPGPLGTPRRGVGRLALETGVPVIPLSVLGTEDVRSGWRLRPRKVRVCFGRQLSFARRQHVDPSLAASVTARIWDCIAAQWESLGGQTTPRGESPRVEPPGVESPRVESPRVEPPGVEPAHVDPRSGCGRLEEAARTPSDPLRCAVRPTVALPAAREDLLAVQRRPYTLQ